MKTEGARAKNKIFLLFYFCSRAFLKWKIRAKYTRPFHRHLKCLDYEK